MLWLEARRTQVRGLPVLAGTFSTVCVLPSLHPWRSRRLPAAGPGGTPRAILGGPSTSVALFLLAPVITIGVPPSAVILDRDDVSGREPVLRHARILPWRAVGHAAGVRGPGAVARHPRRARRTCTRPGAQRATGTLVVQAFTPTRDDRRLVVVGW